MTDSDLAFDAMVELNGKVQRKYSRGLWLIIISGALGAIAASFALIHAAMSIGYNPRILIIPAVASFAGILALAVYGGRALLRILVQSYQDRSIARLSRELNVPEASLRELVPAFGDSAVGYRKLRIRWASPRDRSPLRWP